MSANLPRVFEDVGSGNVKPVEVPLHLSKIGGDFNNEELVSVAQETVRLLLFPVHRCRLPKFKIS